LPDWLSKWVPLTTSITSFFIATYTFIVTTSQPELQLILPRQVRIAQGIETGPYLYLQPVIVSSGQSERSEVILDMMVREI
jgi:hypothetical protein